MVRLVLMRHGESTANADERFGGWQDAPLTQAGIAQARAAGDMLRDQGLRFGAAYTSLLCRATHSCWHALDALDQTWIPLKPTWRLNERHYGALEGMNRAEADERFGAERVRAWRRGHAEAPPPLPAEAWAAVRRDRRYADMAVPLSESLQALAQRLAPFWTEVLLPALQAATADIFVVSHGNTLRALRRLVEAAPPDDRRLDADIPPALPLVYGGDGPWAQPPATPR